MNCSESRRLQRLLSRLWQELRGGGAPGTVPNGSSSSILDGAPSSSALRTPAAGWPGGGGADDAYLYILLIMIFYGCLAGGLILAYTRSKKLESKHDPYHLYIERDWAAEAGGGGGGRAAREPSLDEGRSSGDSEEHP